MKLTITDTTATLENGTLREAVLGFDRFLSAIAYDQGVSHDRVREEVGDFLKERIGKEVEQTEHD